MLSIQFRDVQLLQESWFGVDEAGGGDNVPTHNDVRFAVQVYTGPQNKRTRFVKLRAASGTQDAQDHEQPTGVPLQSALWIDEVDLQDREGHETVEIVLLTEVTRRGRLGRKRYRHSITTVEMRTFRATPEKRIELSRPLRPVSSPRGEAVGEIQLSVMYTDDYCVSQGYLFGMFCGLAPLFLSTPRSNDLPYVPFSIGCIRESVKAAMAVCDITTIVTSQTSSAQTAEEEITAPPPQDADDAADQPPIALFYKPELSSQKTQTISPPPSPLKMVKSVGESSLGRASHLPIVA